MKTVTEYLRADLLTAWVTEMGKNTPIWALLESVLESTNDEGMVPVQVLRTDREQVGQAEARDRQETENGPLVALHKASLGEDIVVGAITGDDPSLQERVFGGKHTSFRRVESKAIRPGHSLQITVLPLVEPYSDLDGLAARLEAGGFKTLDVPRPLRQEETQARMRTAREIIERMDEAEWDGQTSADVTPDSDKVYPGDRVG